jgi:hypothetical protein
MAPTPRSDEKVRLRLKAWGLGGGRGHEAMPHSSGKAGRTFNGGQQWRATDLRNTNVSTTGTGMLAWRSGGGTDLDAMNDGVRGSRSSRTSTVRTHGASAR